MMILPEFLKKGDKIGIVSLAGKAEAKDIDNAVKHFENWGLKVVIGEFAKSSHYQFAGTDEQRASDFQKMLDDKSIKVIISSRGGYGSARIIEQINWTNFIKNPKWIIGFSDITVFHSHLNKKLGVASLHATMPVKFSKFPKSDSNIESLKSVLFGGNIEYEVSNHPLNRQGSVKAELVGGNLSVLYSLRGTNLDLNYENKILFIEDLSEYLYHLDRMMMNFKLGGVFEKISGLIVGSFSDMQDNKSPFGKSAYEIIYDYVKDYNYPVCFDFPAGHDKNNNALILGSKAELKLNTKTCLINWNY